MKTDTRLGTFEEVFASSTDEVRTIGAKLRKIIVALHPECVEVPRAGERSVAYGVGPKKMSEAYVYIMPQSDYVNLGFYHGTALTDFASTLEGSGKRLRHVKIRTLEETDTPELRRLLQAARREREVALGS